MDIKLQIQFPIITTYPQQTNVISIASPHEEFYPWFHSNLIQLKCNNILNRLDLLIYPDNIQRVCPLLDYQVLTRKTLQNWFPDIVGFVMKCVDDELFFHATLNSYYISSYSKFYNQYHRFHEILIYGYNSELEVFYGADFFNYGKYEFHKIPFFEFEMAYKTIDLRNDGEFSLEHGSTNLNFHLSEIELLRFKPRSHFHKKEPYQLDVGNIIDLLGDYLQSSNTSRKYTVFENVSNGIYGFRIYDCLLDHTEGVYTGELKYMDIRSFHILYEHKKCMSLRFKYLSTNSKLSHLERYLERLGEIEKQSMVLSNLTLRYLVSLDKQIVKKISSGLKQMAAKEEAVLNEIYEDLSNMAL
ncbi:hypothetical protein A8L34_09555 [Bacillus sp. FJAT-27264]|uniref:hypothetical protein n=1 Tax=Paenibacillus sp. (strain DSM 101736 / FJAT-27264) TaxID=1850362 RepID=UPI000807A63B|nr:hypothetical protein [Bacillus sp. FJAT-27264]OBZ14196.1 hypothetical protein A8L34_09555 [Bacillus sp. FJAT-27264]